MGQAGSVQKPFLTDVKTLRERARKNLGDGAIGSNYVVDVIKTFDIFHWVLAS
jgi:bacterioferritin